MPFTAPYLPKISFGAIYSVYGIIKRLTTIRKSCPAKAPSQKLKMTDRNVHLFYRYMSKNRHMAVADLVRWANKALEKLFLKHLCVDISKDVATHSINHSSLQRIKVCLLRGSNITKAGLPRSGKGYCRQMNPIFRFHMEMFVEKLLERRMKQMIHLVAITCFLTQAPWPCGVDHNSKWGWQLAFSQGYDKSWELYTHS